MKINILLFARLREIFGQDTVTLEVPGPIRVHELVTLLVAQYPAFEPFRDFCRVAVNQTYAPDPDTVIDEQSEVALIPPVSGG